MSQAVYDVAIVGAGIVGAACADELSQRGLRVAMVEREIVGCGATAAGMGHVVVMDDSEAQFALDPIFAEVVAETAQRNAGRCGVRAMRHDLGSGR